MAIAPERMGIGIRRHFTTEGVHPYDEVTWERRDARITNYLDGTIAFEQLGVEVPSTWSVNATNILAQKYFRGAPGSPEREWSLKQVADRVADTITAWGAKDGYFVDLSEAEAFNAELKHLIVQQKAAFNSPVWFNIGVKGRKQQSSACQPYHALVSTPEGLVPIGRLVEENAVGTKVFDASGITRVVAVKTNGRKQVLRIHLKAGHTLDVTPDHLVWRAAPGGGRFVEAAELRPCDQLEWHRRESIDATPSIEAVEIDRIESLGELDVYDIQTESGEYLSENLRVHNCFILAVEDSMSSILNWYVEEGTIFKGGSGAGVNLSRIRSSRESLRGGGTASGPVSFMRGADASAGTIKSGGTTRRAAKMVILNADHPDIEDFVWCKAIEERKARALRDAGFDMDLDGKDSASIQYQNANNSVRVSDEFMQAVLDDADWHLRAVTTGEVLETVKARELFRQIATAAWECADPGLQYDTTINRWHTVPNTGPITASNPCFPGDALVHTDKGLIPFENLMRRAVEGETFGVYTHDVTNPDAPAERLEITSPEAFMVTGLNEIVKLRFDNGMELRCTPNHRIFTTNRGYVEAAELTQEDDVKVLDLPAPAVSASLRFRVSSLASAYARKGDQAKVRLPEKWSPEFAHYVGWLIGDGCISSTNVASTIYGSDEDREHVLPRHRDLLTDICDGQAPKPSVQANGTQQLRLGRGQAVRFLQALGVTPAKAPAKVVPWAVDQAPPDIVAAFLQGLFDADGRVYDGKTDRYVGLGSASEDLLKGVQRLLSTFGIFSRIYRTRKGGEDQFTYVRKDGTFAIYEGSDLYDLRISCGSVALFAENIGFSLPAKKEKLDCLLLSHSPYAQRTTVRLVERDEDGVALTYNLSEPKNHSYIVNGLVVRNCSEYLSLDNSACNLASINLLRYLNDDSSFDVEGFKSSVEVLFTAQEILVGNSDYPTDKIGEVTKRFRQLGLGYANLGALLMAQGMAYDSGEGRAWAGAITALMTGHAYATSARTACRMGPFGGYHDNAEHMQRVLRMHRTEAANIDEELVPPELLSAAQQSWDTAVDLCDSYGVRNSQATVLAPTGCLVGGTLVPTERGLVRLRSLGDTSFDADQWQDLGISVQTDEGLRTATQFYVNGLEPVVAVHTKRGYRIKGTPQHRIKVVDRATGEWVWRRLSDVSSGDSVPLALGQLIGEPQEVDLPPLPDAYWTGERHAVVPRQVTAELAELVGYFMGDGSMHARGLRFCVTAGDFDVVERLLQLGKEVFNLVGHVTEKRGYTEVRLDSVRLVLWWEACGFAKRSPAEGHSGKGYVAHVPDAILHSNDRDVYAAFLRGLFEADGTVTSGYPHWMTTSLELAGDVQSLLLALGFPTTRTVESKRTGWGDLALSKLRLLNLSSNDRWMEEIGFIGARKNAKVTRGADLRQSAKADHIPLGRALIDRLVPENDRLRRVLLMECKRGAISRRIAEQLYERTGDPELRHFLSFFYDEVASAELGDEELTYDLSVPENVTYVANGFVSHNTISFLLDCDTTGVEPDLGLCKTKKLVGGGTMTIVNQTVPRALRQLGYSDEQVDDIVAYIDQNKSIIGAPHLSADHLGVFACSMGDNVIDYMGHVRMMAAVQPFISGALSKCVEGETLVTTADGLVRLGSLYQDEAPDTFRHEVVEVASLDGTQKTDAFYYGGVRPVWEAVLRSGHRVVGTPNHRVLIANHDGLAWRRLDELEEGDHVAVKYGAELWSQLPARFDRFEPTASYGCQKKVRIPEEMTEDLALLLGMYAAEGHLTRTNWTITITNSVDSVLERAAGLWRSLFGVETKIVRQPDKCPGVVVASKTVVEFLDALGCGGRAREKRIPDAVLRSPRNTVLAFLQGLALDAYVSISRAGSKWGICVDSPGLLDDLQALLTNFGVVHGRISKHNKLNGKTYDEVFVCGDSATKLLQLVPFLEPDKAARARPLAEREESGRHKADLVPGIAPYELYRLLPEGRSGRNGFGVRSEFSFLCDPRTLHVTRRTLERVAAVPGVVLPQWLRTVLDDGLHFSPVQNVVQAAHREVYDLSVPATQAFVGNGIVNHNTVNMPEHATVEEVEELYVDSWKMGIKALAIYRDNCKVAQPLATTKKAVPPASEAEAHDRELAAKVAELEKALDRQTVVVKQPMRERLPRRRRSATFAFRVADCEGYVTVGEYDDGRPGEVFMKVSKQGSTLAGIMDAFSISVSLGLQHGVPLKTFVAKYTNMRFEPAGMTDDPDLRIATSLADYIFRRLAVDYLTLDERAELGIHTTSERSQPTLPGVEELATPSAGVVTADPAPAPSQPVVPQASDAPYCYQCGNIMTRAGSCFACPACGATSGCS